MIRKPLLRAFCVLLMTLAPGAHAAAEGLDWDVQEKEEAALPVLAARNVRDGVLTFGDAFMDANTGLFGLFSMLTGQVTMAASDGIGLIDDNPLTQYVTKGFFSKNLAKVAYLWHVAGSESLLGGHGLEVERWATQDVASLNPLLIDQDVDGIGGPLPLDPLDFVGEATIHSRVYRPHAVVISLGAVTAADVVMRPVAGFLRILQFRKAGNAVDRKATDLVRRSLRTGW